MRLQRNHVPFASLVQQLPTIPIFITLPPASQLRRFQGLQEFGVVSALERDLSPVLCDQISQWYVWTRYISLQKKVCLGCSHPSQKQNLNHRFAFSLTSRCPFWVAWQHLPLWCSPTWPAPVQTEVNGMMFGHHVVSWSFDNEKKMSAPTRIMTKTMCRTWWKDHCTSQD